MPTFDSLIVNRGNILDLWFEVEQNLETTVVSPDTVAPFTEDDKVGTRSTPLVTGEQINLTTRLSYSPLDEPTLFSFVSDNPEDIDVTDDGTIIQVEPESTASANITVTATNGSSTRSRVFSVTLNLSVAGYTVDVIEGGTTGSARKALSDPLNNALDGADPATQQSLYTLQDHDGSNYVRNPNFLIQGTHAEALTCASPWNSRQGRLRAGTAITPRHVVCAQHYPLYAGDSLRFVTSDNVVVTRTVVQADEISDGNDGNDSRLLLLDSDLPSTITPCKLFPSNYETYLPSGSNSYAAAGLPILALDQQEKGIILRLGREADPQHKAWLWYKPQLSLHLNFWEPIVVGDSGNPVFAVIGSELWLLSTFLGSGTGPFYGRIASEVNAKITELDTLQGDITGYTVTEGDLSSFNTY